MGELSVAELLLRAEQPGRPEQQWAPPRLPDLHRTPDTDRTADANPAPSRAAHREPSTRSRSLGHWLAGALAAAAVLTTSMAVSGTGRPGPGTDAAVAAGTDPLAEPDPLARPDDSPETATAEPGAPPTTGRADPAPRKTVDCGSRPGRVLNLANWKLTLPTGASEKPTEVAGSKLSGFTSADWFSTKQDCAAVAFRAPVNGVTTSGSKNPRSELREMVGNGTDEAGWSSSSGTHTMTVREAFTKLPQGKPHLVGAQIHDAEDDVSVFRLEGRNLYVTNGDDPHHQLVTGDYELGTPFEAKYVVSGGQTKAYYNGRLVTTIAKAYSGAYFKAGAYTQANCENAAPCTSGNYGETLIYDLKVSHS